MATPKKPARTSKKKARTTPKPPKKKQPLALATTDCCASILSAASGTLFTVEDGVIYQIDPPTVYSRFIFNPDTGFPEWEAIDPNAGGGGNGGGGGFGGWSYSYGYDGWDSGTASESPTCANPGMPPFPDALLGASAYYDCTSGTWAYYPPP